MLKSMTGFGKAQATLANKVLNIEIKSLNSKQMDIMVRLPHHYKEKELEIRNLVAQSLHRGKVELVLWFDGETERNVVINEKSVQSYYEQLQSVSNQLGAEATGSDLLQIVMRMSDVMQSDRPTLSDEEWKVVVDTVNEALGNLQEFRTQEGDALALDMRNHIQTIVDCVEKVPPYEEERNITVRQKLQQSLEGLSNGINFDKDRLEQEIIYYLEKYDINEEKVRLANHCKYFLETLDVTKPIGKKLGFIGQEIGREINTMGSKANHTEIQKLVVQMKEELEQIKEQVLNAL